MGHPIHAIAKGLRHHMRSRRPQAPLGAPTLSAALLTAASLTGAALTAPLPLRSQEAAPWPDTDGARLKALALIQTLNAELLASPSATRTLQHWCQRHRLAAEPKIVAVRLPGAEQPPSAEQRQRLAVTTQEPVRHRRVQLRCGERLLAEADNWYVPGRLSAPMNRLLDATNTPFGQVIAPLKPYRRTLAMRLLWQPLPEGWERQPPPTTKAITPAKPQPLAIPAALMEHRAVVYAADHRPLAEVLEVIQRQILPPNGWGAGSVASDP